MEFYETQEMTADQMKQFTIEFDRIIGTEREVNDSPGHEYRYYAICGDLLPSEVRTVQEIENRILNR